jgi:hypothetical protein
MYRISWYSSICILLYIISLHAFIWTLYLCLYQFRPKNDLNLKCLSVFDMRIRVYHCICPTCMGNLLVCKISIRWGPNSFWTQPPLLVVWNVKKAPYQFIFKWAPECMEQKLRRPSYSIGLTALVINWHIWEHLCW